MLDSYVLAAVIAVSKKTDTKWNSSTFCRTASQKFRTAPQKVEQVMKAGYRITNCGTVPQFVEQLLLKVACYFKCGTVCHF